LTAAAVPAGTAADLVVVGRIGAPHGVSGALRVVSFTQPADNLFAYRPWFLDSGNGYRTVDVEDVRQVGNHLIVRLAGVNHREAAARLRGRSVAVPRSALPALESGSEYYWQDLIGLSVVDRERGVLGEVTALMETGAHDVLVVDDGRVLIPFVAAFVEAVELDEGVIRVAWVDPR
jgi:16S rRNA processing protein RimM